MAANNVRIKKNPYGVMRFRTEANIKLGIAAGDAMMVAGTGTNYADIVTNGAPTRGTDTFIGVSHNAATNTASADGVIDIELVGPGTILEAKATTVTNINTDAKLLAMLNDVTNFDRSAATAAGTLTIDETNTTAAKSSTLSLVIIDGDIIKGLLFVAPCASILTGSNI
jgi:hypothetical protein